MGGVRPHIDYARPMRPIKRGEHRSRAGSIKKLGKRLLTRRAQSDCLPLGKGQTPISRTHALTLV